MESLNQDGFILCSTHCTSHFFHNCFGKYFAKSTVFSRCFTLMKMVLSIFWYKYMKRLLLFQMTKNAFATFCALGNFSGNLKREQLQNNARHDKIGLYSVFIKQMYANFTLKSGLGYQNVTCVV